MTPLDEARTAWRHLVSAERTVDRLRAWPHRLTPAMKTDLHAAERTMREARDTLQRVLG